MKFLICFTIFLISVGSFATEIKSSDKSSSKVSVARIVKLTHLINNDQIQVNIVLHDLGGSTDVSPTQVVYLTMYSKGEMFSTDATFEIAKVLSLNSTKKISKDIYEVNVTVFDDTIRDVTFFINAKSALNDIRSVQCDDFDCDASTYFSTSISVTKK